MSDLPLGLPDGPDTLENIMREVEACERAENDGELYSQDHGWLLFADVPNVNISTPFKEKSILAAEILHGGVTPYRFVGEGACRYEIIREAVSTLLKGNEDRLFDLVSTLAEEPVETLLRNKRQHGTWHIYMGPVLLHVHVSWLQHFEEWARNYYESL